MPTPANSRLLAAALLAFAASAARAEDVLGIRDDSSLVTFDAADAANVLSQRAVFGLQDGEIILGADISPVDGGLYAVGSTSRLYKIEQDTGAAHLIGSTSFSTLLEGSDFGVSFDTAGTELRVTSNFGQNLVIDPATGAIASIDATLRYATGEANAGAVVGVSALAWMSDKFTGPALYGIDHARGLLVRIETPSAGSVRAVGPLGVAGLANGGFASLDISSATGTAYAVFDVQGQAFARVYSVNLATGAATPMGTASPSLIRGAAVIPSSPPALPGTLLVGLAGAADLVTFTVGSPQSILSTVHVRGLPLGEPLAAIAFRPSNGFLYGITHTGLYDVDMQGGTAQRVGAGFAEALPAGPLACDFDPTTDRLRVVGGSGLNLRIDASTGGVVDTNPLSPGTQTDAPFAFAPGDLHDGQLPAVQAIAFTGRTTPGTPSKCFVLESTAILARLGTAATGPDEARDGLLRTIGPMSVEDLVGLPASLGMTATGPTTAYAALATGATSSSLFHVDLTTGASAVVAPIGASGVLRGLTAQPTAGPARVYVNKMAIKLGFKKHGRDTLALRGSAPYAVGGLAGKTVTLDIGGLSLSFTLNAKGAGKSGKSTIKLAGSGARGIGLKIALARVDLVAVLGDEGMNGSLFAFHQARQVLLTMTYDGKTYRTLVDLVYSAKLGKSGSAKTN